MADDRTCPNCHGLVTQGEEFCPTCGEWLGLEGGEEPEHFTLGGDNYAPDPGPSEPRQVEPSGPAPSDHVRCPLCGSDNPRSNRHCENCGARLAGGQLPVAPQPMIQTTAAMRTALIAGGVLVVVVVVAFLVNALTGEEEPAAESTSTTTTTVADASQVVVTDIQCSDEYPGHPCTNLIDASDVDWNAPIPPAGEVLTIQMTFDKPYALTYVEITNLPEDDDRFIRNYRVQGIRLSASDAATPFSKSLPDQGGALAPIEFRTLGSTSLTIEILSTYPSQGIGEGEDIQPGFQDLSIAEIRVFGTPAG